MRLHLIQLEALQTQLRELRSIVDVQQKRGSSFAADTVTWLRALESHLEQARMPAVGEIAAIRSRLLVVIHKADAGEGPIRRRREAAASSAVRDAQATVQRVIAPHEERFREAEDLASRLGAVAQVKGYLAEVSESAHQAALEHIVRRLGADPDAAAGLVHLRGLVGDVDAKILLDRSLPSLV